MEITIKKSENLKPIIPEDQLGFGNYFTDHMFVVDYTEGEGWHNARIVPFANITLHPASTVLHYGAEVFEGLKAYRNVDGSVQLFRPMENIKRLNNSAERLSMPQLDEQFTLEALKQFVKIEERWVPYSVGTSLYLRPFMFGNDQTLGVHTVKNVTFMIIASPSGSYYKEGINPVKIMIEPQDVRTVRGGTGYAKCGGNYAASTRAGEKAEKMGYTQVLWLDGIERKYVEEVGSMNVMFKIDGVIVTPEISSGSILPGITRKSCIEMLQSLGYKVEERKISVDELISALENGKLEEAWGTGTAAVVSPIGLLAFGNKEYVVSNGKIGKVTQMLYDELTGIQWGQKTDKFGWICKI